MTKRSFPGTLSVLLILSIFLPACDFSESRIFIEAESFDTYGGWMHDGQFIDQMGSPYLIAHGLGTPVEDARSRFYVEDPGQYHVYARTFNWMAPHMEDESAGLFRIGIDEQLLDTVFGKGPDHWGWSHGGSIELDSGMHDIFLRDMTGFDGRIDAIFLSKVEYERVSEQPYKLFRLRTQTGGIPSELIDKGNYDLVVIGGGLAGVSTAATAARQGLKTALITDSSLPAGNPELQSITGNNYGTQLDIFTQVHMNWLEKEDQHIRHVYGIHTRTGQQYVFHGSYFADCTGDGTVGRLAGAAFRYGRESFEESGEARAPEQADSIGMKVYTTWSYRETNEFIKYPELSWMSIDSSSFMHPQSGAWCCTGTEDRNNIEEAEYLRDANLLSIYSYWSFLQQNYPDQYGSFQLEDVSLRASKRESVRLEGDIMLTAADVDLESMYPDTVLQMKRITNPTRSKLVAGSMILSPLASGLDERDELTSYNLPYRCLYSKNIGNLFMAGRDISISHILLNETDIHSSEVQMGKIAGLAASLCIKYECSPSEINTSHLESLRELLY